MNDILYSHSAEETQKIGQDFAKGIKSSKAICLYGNLGAGKTTFVQGFAKGLGIKKRIISPTFNIIRSYVIARNVVTKQSRQFKEKIGSENDGIASPSASWRIELVRNDVLMFYHVDLYRLRGEQDIEGTGLLDVLNDKNAVIVIEWPEKLGMLLPKKRWDIWFRDMGGDRREIQICSFI